MFFVSVSNAFLVVCPTHHRQFDSGHFVLVPSRRQRDSMRDYEESDFAMREESLAQRRGDPGRTFPEVSTIGNIVVCRPADVLPFEAH
jgi:hypothetical protein